MEAPAEGIFRDRGSKFIGLIYPVKKESEIKDILQALKKEHFGANHHCYAYRLGANKQNFRANDDGEPTGSAGRPILNQIQSKDLTDVLIVVVRYFGGTLLGVPGLINAYKNAALEAINASKVQEKHVRVVYSTLLPFERTNDVMRILKDNDAKVLEQNYTATSCEFIFAVRKEKADKLEDSLRLLFDVSFKFVREE